MISRRRSRFAIVTAALVAGDLASKAWAGRALGDGPIVLPGPLDLQLDYNDGIAFGFFDRLPAVALIAASLLIAALLVRAWDAGHAPAVPTSMIVAGAVGNGTDRARVRQRRRHVAPRLVANVQRRRRLHHHRCRTLDRPRDLADDTRFPCARGPLNGNRPVRPIHCAMIRFPRPVEHADNGSLRANSSSRRSGSKSNSPDARGLSASRSYSRMGDPVGPSARCRRHEPSCS